MPKLLAEVFPPGEFLQDELDARQWTQAEFAQIIDRPAQLVSEIISGTRDISRQTAAEFGAAFGQSPQYWLNLQSSYNLWLASQSASRTDELDAVEKRALLAARAPVAELRKRGLVTTKDLDQTIVKVCGLLGIDDIRDDVAFLAAARRANRDHDVSPTQRTWLACARRAAEEVREVAPYSPERLGELASRLPQLLNTPEAFEDLPHLVADAGVRLVYVEQFPSSHLSGATFLHADDPNQPVIALSGRGKRLDKVLFTLLHEVGHLLEGHVAPDELVIDEDGHDDPREAAADQRAAAWCFPGGLPHSAGAIRKPWVDRTAAKFGVHPIVVVGHLQHLGRLDWRTSLVRGAPTVVDQLESWSAKA